MLTLFTYSHSALSQESFNDGKISVTSEVLNYEDRANDKFYKYYNFTVKNGSSENQKIELIINYKQNGVQKSSQTRDENLDLELEPGETVSGDLQNINTELYERLNDTLQNLDRLIQRIIQNYDR